MMKRSKFVKHISLLGILPALGIKKWDSDKALNGGQLKQELITAWKRSEQMTLVNMEQMPSESYEFKYTDEAMTFSEQWRHCVVFTCAQLSARAGVANPFEGVKLPIQMPKDRTIKEIKRMYVFVRESIQSLSIEKLNSTVDFAGDQMPLWRLFYAMENHIIHHRGQCIVYLRLNGVIPKGYFGW